MTSARTPPNPATIAVSRLYETQAQAVANALDHIRSELAMCGTPAAQTLNDTPHGSNENTATEAGALQAVWLHNQAAQIHDNIRAAALIAYNNAELLTQILGTRLSHTADPPRCYVDPGIDGYLTPLDQGGFFDPSCNNYSRSASGGPCDACRSRLARFRQRMKLKALNDERTVDYDSEVHYVDGVAVVRPTRGGAT